MPLVSYNTSHLNLFYSQEKRKGKTLHKFKSIHVTYTLWACCSAEMVNILFASKQVSVHSYRCQDNLDFTDSGNLSIKIHISLWLWTSLSPVAHVDRWTTSIKTLLVCKHVIIRYDVTRPHSSGGVCDGHLVYSLLCYVSVQQVPDCYSWKHLGLVIRPHLSDLSLLHTLQGTLIHTHTFTTDITDKHTSSYPLFSFV